MTFSPNRLHIVIKDNAIEISEADPGGNSMGMEQWPVARIDETGITRFLLNGSSTLPQDDGKFPDRG